MKLERKVIDSHLHLYSWFDDDGKTFFEIFDDYQARNGLKNINLCALPYYHGDVSNNIMCALYKLHNPTAYSYAGMVYPELPVKLPLPQGMDSKTQYEEFMEIGFDGVKLLESKPLEQKEIKLPINNDFYEDFFAKAEKDGTHIIWHVGDPNTFWDPDKIPQWAYDRGWTYFDGTYPTLEDTYGQVFDVLDKHPNLKATFAHFFFWADYPEKVEELFKKYPNVTVDLVPGSEMFAGFSANHEKYEEFFKKYADRVLYGTDISFPVNYSYWDHLAHEVYNVIATDKEIDIYTVKCKGFDLPDDVTDKILYGNFLNKCHTAPNKINLEALKKYVNKYKSLIKDEKTVELIYAFIEDYEKYCV